MWGGQIQANDQECDDKNGALCERKGNTFGKFYLLLLCAHYNEPPLIY